MTGDSIQAGNIQGVGIAIGTGASVTIYGDVHYYPITLQAPLREVFDPLIEDRVRLFGGRGAILAQIGARIQESAGSYVCVTAPAGFGKTALMAALVSRTPEAFAYHFFTPLYDGLSEAFFLRNVVQQMATWHHHTAQLPTDLNELRALYQHFLDTPLEHTRVLVLDGLDEVSAWQLWPYLSRRLPDRLHIILTIRDVGQDWQAEYRLLPEQVQHLPLGGLDQDEVIAVLHAAGPRAFALADDPALLDGLLTVAAYEDNPALGSDPFYVRLLAEDGAAGVLSAATIASQPRGLTRYLDQWLHDVVRRTGEAGDSVQAVMDLLGTLVVALGPLPRADLEALHASLRGGIFRPFPKAVATIRRFVTGDDTGGYTLLHPRFRRYLRQHPDVNVADYRGKLLDYCAAWEHHHSRYTLDYYVRHLIEAGRHTELAALLRRFAWMQARLRVAGVRALTGDYELALRSTEILGDDERRLLRRVLRTLRFTAHILAQDPTQLPGQLIGRLLDVHEPVVEALLAEAAQGLDAPWLRPLTAGLVTPDTAQGRTLIGHDAEVRAIAIAPNGRTAVSAAADGSLIVWDTGDDPPYPIHTLPIGAPIHAAAVAPDCHRALCGTDDGRLFECDIDAGKILRSAPTPAAIEAIAITADNRFGVLGFTGDVSIVWDITNWCEEKRIATGGTRTRSLGLSADGRTAIFGGTEDDVTICDLHSGDSFSLWQGNDTWISAVAIAPDGSRALGGDHEGRIMLWSLPQRQRIASYIAHKRYDDDGFLYGTCRVTALAVTPDGMRVISAGDDGDIVVLDLTNLSPLSKIYAGPHHIYQLAITPDGARVISAAADHALQVWELDANGIRRPAAPTGTDVATRPAEDLSAWDKLAHALARRATPAADQPLVVPIPARGLELAPQPDGTIVVRSTTTGNQETVLEWHSAPVAALAVTPDGRRAVSAAADYCLVLWDLVTRQPLANLNADEPLDACVIAPDGVTIVVRGRSGTMHYLRLENAPLP